MSRVNLLAVAAVVCSVFALFGCGRDGPELADVTGVVTLDGKPVTGADVSFVPETSGGSPSFAQTDENGRYQMMFTRTTSGAMLGKHRVKITTTKYSKSEAEDMRASGFAVSDEYIPIPKKYREPGALTAEVNSGDNEIDFPLTNQ